MRKTSLILSLILAAGMFFSCGKQNPNFKEKMVLDGSAQSGDIQGTSRTANDETRRVLIVYSAGYNSLSNYLSTDINDLLNGYAPTPYRTSNVLLLITRLTKRYLDYSSPSEPLLIQITRKEGGETVCDTLRRWDGSRPIASPDFMREALEYVKLRFPAASYGMVISSHGTGWLPWNYYSYPELYEGGDTGDTFWAPGKRTLGQDVGDSVDTNAEIELKDLPEVIPFHLDYFLVDACLMGGIELAYQMKDVCDYIGFSQTEILADGFDYLTAASRLIENRTADPEQVCRDYFEAYENNPSASYRCATISFVDCRKLEPLADVCSDLFSKYNQKIRSLNPYTIQGYFRQGKHYFYDLQDILLHCGLTAEEKEALQQALDGAVVYKAATPTFLGIDINVHSGFSMYLPANGTSFLDSFYKENIAWNARTGLVQ